MGGLAYDIKPEKNYPILLWPSYGKDATLCYTFLSFSRWFAYVLQAQISNLSKVTALLPTNLVSTPEQVWTRSCFYSVTNYL